MAAIRGVKISVTWQAARYGESRLLAGVYKGFTNITVSDAPTP